MKLFFQHWTDKSEQLNRRLFYSLALTVTTLPIEDFLSVDWMFMCEALPGDSMPGEGRWSRAPSPLPPLSPLTIHIDHDVDDEDDVDDYDDDYGAI